MTANVRQQLEAAGVKIAPENRAAASRTRPAALQQTTAPAAPKEGPTDAQIQKRKDAQQRREEAALSKLNEQALVHYQVGAGESTLGTVKVFHLSPSQQSELVEWLQIQLKASRI